jgi:hypothetical protein
MVDGNSLFLGMCHACLPGDCQPARPGTIVTSSLATADMACVHQNLLPVCSESAAGILVSSTGSTLCFHLLSP